MPVHSGDLNASFAPTLPERATAETLQRQCVGNRRRHTLIKWHGSVFSPSAGTPLKFTRRFKSYLQAEMLQRWQVGNFSQEIPTSDTDCNAALSHDHTFAYPSGYKCLAGARCGQCGFSITCGCDLAKVELHAKPSCKFSSPAGPAHNFHFSSLNKSFEKNKQKKPT